MYRPFVFKNYFYFLLSPASLLKIQTINVLVIQHGGAQDSILALEHLNMLDPFNKWCFQFSFLFSWTRSPMIGQYLCSVCFSYMKVVFTLANRYALFSQNVRRALFSTLCGLPRNAKVVQNSIRNNFLIKYLNV